MAAHCQGRKSSLVIGRSNEKSPIPRHLQRLVAMLSFPFQLQKSNSRVVFDQRSNSFLLLHTLGLNQWRMSDFFFMISDKGRGNKSKVLFSVVRFGVSFYISYYHMKVRAKNVIYFFSKMILYLIHLFTISQYDIYLLKDHHILFVLQILLSYNRCFFPCLRYSAIKYHWIPLCVNRTVNYKDGITEHKVSVIV